jgi:hypothetical protein
MGIGVARQAYDQREFSEAKATRSRQRKHSSGRYATC